MCKARGRRWHPGWPNGPIPRCRPATVDPARWTRTVPIVRSFLRLLLVPCQLQAPAPPASLAPQAPQSPQAPQVPQVSPRGRRPRLRRPSPQRKAPRRRQQLRKKRSTQSLQNLLPRRMCRSEDHSKPASNQLARRLPVKLQVQVLPLRLRRPRLLEHSDLPLELHRQRNPRHPFQRLAPPSSAWPWRARFAP